MSIAAHQMMAWLSPAFPTGAFAYSHGLEQAIADGDVKDAQSFETWLQFVMHHGALWNDLIILVQTYNGEKTKDLAEALFNASERRTESMQTGAAFAATASELLDVTIEPAPLPFVVGQAAAIAKIEIKELLPLYAHSFVANLVSAGVRLIPIGGVEGQKLLQKLFPEFDALAQSALDADFSDLKSSAWGADIAAMRHETMQTRIFRS